MIRQRTDDAHLVEPPFFATAEPTLDSSGRETGEGVVSFAKGKIFHCYNSFYDRQEEQLKAQNERKYFSKGADWHYPTNIDESFTYETGDKFYLKPDKQEENSRIFKVGKETEIDLDGYILIWEAFEKDGEFGNTQFLSENVFLQNTQEFRQIAFTSHLLEEKENGDKRYRMNGGWVCIFNKGIAKFIPSFDYEVKNGKEKYHYIKLSVSITEKSDSLNIRQADRVFIKDFSVDKIEVIEEQEELDVNKAQKKAGVGKACVNPDEEFTENGEYFMKIPQDDVQRLGNININLEVTNVSTKTIGMDAIAANLLLDDGIQRVDKITFGATDGDGESPDFSKTSCQFPEEMPIIKRYQGSRRNASGDFVADTLDIVDSVIDRSGRGRYNPRTLKVPNDFFIDFFIDGQGKIQLNEDDTYTECDKFIDHGEFPTIDITSRVISKTSFVEIKFI